MAGGGVEAFLVLGAFFLTRKQLKIEQEQIQVGKSFVHRIKRLYPAYILLVLIATAGYIYAKQSLTAESLWYILSLQNFRCLFDKASYSLNSLLGHFWYISLDVWLFLLWVVIIRFVPSKQLRIAFILSVIVGIAWRTTCILGDKYAASYMIPVGQLDCWALGGLAALNIKNKGNNELLMWSEIVLGVCGMIALTLYNAYISGCNYVESYQLWHNSGGYIHNILTGNIHFFIAILSVGLLRYCIDTSRKHSVLSSVPLVALGGMTYELYCFHYPIIFAVKHFVHNEVIMVIMSLLATLVVAYLWNRFAMPKIKRVLG